MTSPSNRRKDRKSKKTPNFFSKISRNLPLLSPLIFNKANSKLEIPKKLDYVSIVSIYAINEEEKKEGKKRRRKRRLKLDENETRRNETTEGKGGRKYPLPHPLITRSRINPNAEIKIKSRSEINVGTA